MAHKTKKHLSFKTWFTRFWKSKLFYVVGVMVLVLVSSSVVKEIVRRITIQRDIKQLETDISQLEDRNNDVLALLQSLNSSSTLEKEARTKLGLQKTGETVISLGQQQVTSAPTLEQVGSSLDTRTNIEKWLDAFLHT